MASEGRRRESRRGGGEARRARGGRTGAVLLPEAEQQHVVLPAKRDAGASNTRQPIPAKTDYANGLVQNPSEPAQVQGSSSPHGPTAHSRDHIAAAAYAKSDPFDVKKPIYAESPYVLTSQIAGVEEWTEQAIDDRQDQLALLAIQAWPAE
jgi:Protein of unknown function (DUF1524)